MVHNLKKEQQLNQEAIISASADFNKKAVANTHLIAVESGRANAAERELAYLRTDVEDKRRLIEDLRATIERLGGGEDEGPQGMKTLTERYREGDLVGCFFFVSESSQINEHLSED